jgi:hypothetical protein
VSKKNPPDLQLAGRGVAVRPRGTTTQRGYGTHHIRLRERWRLQVERGEVECARCGRLIQAKGLPCSKCGKNCGWDLDHDRDRSVYLGPSHACCNRATGAHRVQRRRQLTAFSEGPYRPRKRSRDW